MKDKLIYILFGLLYINAFYGWIKKDNVKSYDYLRTEYNKVKNQIKTIENERIKDSIFVYDASREQRDSLRAILNPR